MEFIVYTERNITIIFTANIKYVHFILIVRCRPDLMVMPVRVDCSLAVVFTCDAVGAIVPSMFAAVGFLLSANAMSCSRLIVC